METTALNTLGGWSSAVSLPLGINDHRKWNLPKVDSIRRCTIVADLQGSNFRWRKATTSRANVATEATKIPTSVPVRVAHELAQAGYRYLDVRTPEEFNLGHPSSAINVPYMYRVGSGMVKNPSFLRQVSSHFRKHDEIIIGCESGQRSLMASSDLLTAGFTAITDIAGGYTAWTENELPVEE